MKRTGGWLPTELHYMGRQIQNISGFFFDEDKGKYFPNHMKSLYEKERKAKKEKITRIDKEYQNQISSQNLDRFMMISRPRCDFILQKLERCQVHEIIWPNDIQIIANEKKYFRYSFFSFSTLYTFEEVQLDTETQNHRISDLCVYDKLKNNIKILKFGFLDQSNKFFYTLHCDNSESSNESPILQVFEINFTRQIKRLEAKYRLRLDLNNPLVLTDSGGFIYAYGELEKDDKNFKNNKHISTSTSTFTFTFIEMEIFNNVLVKKKENLKISKEVTCFENFSIGLVVACTGGKLFFDGDSFGKNKTYQLEESAVKWMHYYEKMLLVFTFHGNFVLINLETGNQQVIFKLSDLSVHFSNNNNFNFKFEDFKIEATGKIILVGYRNGTEIAVYNFLEISRGPIRTFSFQKKVEQFKISADCSNLYIHHLD